MKNGSLVAGATLATLLVLAALAGAAVSIPAPAAADLGRAFAPPSAAHWLGCDAFGVDLGLELLAGARRSLSIALVVTALSLAGGLVVGTAAALAPRPLDGLVTRFIDSVLAFPGLLLAILLASIMPRSEHTVVLALALTGWAPRARFCRTICRQIARAPFVEAAVSIGAGRIRLLRLHIWPPMLGQLLVQGALGAGSAIIAETSLSFLGLAGSGGETSWGQLIAQGRDYLIEAPHLSIFPGLAFIASVLAFNWLAEGLRGRLTLSNSPVRD